MEYSYKPKGVCSYKMVFDIDEDDIIRDLKVSGGCNGNLKGISELVKGMKVGQVIQKLSGIVCGFRTTSCPDQIAKALIEYSSVRDATHS